MTNPPSSLCPKCAGPVPEDSVWFWGGRFYCSERCVRLALTGKDIPS